jgi:hypothetical protein
MKTPGFLLTVALFLGLALGARGVRAADQEVPVKYVVTLSTETTALPFAMPNIPNMANMPGMAAMFKPRRLISGEAEYPHQAVAPIFVTVPVDLMLPANQLVLKVPQPATGGATTAGGQGGGGQSVKMEIINKLYWHPEVAQGPESSDVTIDTSQFQGPRGMVPPTGNWAKIQEQMARSASGSNGKLPETVVGQGNYILNTGGLTIPLGGFLPAIKVETPASLNAVNLPDGIQVTWDPVPGARGFILHAMSMTRSPDGSQMTLIRWVSTMVKPPERVQNDYEQATSIADDLANGILLPATATSCMVPPGIFPPTPDMFTLNVIAVGNDFFDNHGGITMVGKIRAKWNGMKMKMQGNPGMPPQGAGG